MSKVYCGICQEPAFSDQRFCRNCGCEIMSAAIDVEQDIRIRLDHKPQGCIFFSILKFIFMIAGFLIVISFLGGIFRGC